MLFSVPFVLRIRVFTKAASERRVSGVRSTTKLRFIANVAIFNFLKNKKDDCAPSPTMLHLPLHVIFSQFNRLRLLKKLIDCNRLQLTITITPCLLCAHARITKCGQNESQLIVRRIFVKKVWRTSKFH